MASLLSIRDLTVAAPLKHDQIVQRSDGPVAYPRPDGRGPIEARTSWTSTWGSRSPIRDLTVAAPLKLDFIDGP